MPRDIQLSNPIGEKFSYYSTTDWDERVIILIQVRIIKVEKDYLIFIGIGQEFSDKKIPSMEQPYVSIFEV